MDTLFFWVSKLVWLIISPDSLLVILSVAGFALLYKGIYKAAKAVLGFVVFVMLAIALFPVGEWLLYPLESRFEANPKLPEKVDGVIVLSGAESAYRSSLWHQVELGDAAERDFVFMRLMKAYPDAEHVFTGGTGSMTRQQYKAADVARKLFEELGFDTTKITFETASKNTYENAKYTGELVKPESSEKWILVTTAYHMPRSVGIFEKSGWPVIAYPVDHYTHPDNLLRIHIDFSGNLNVLKHAVKEWVGLTAYYLTGKTTAFIPGPSRS